jgi:hypothetical protein
MECCIWSGDGVTHIVFRNEIRKHPRRQWEKTNDKVLLREEKDPDKRKHTIASLRTADVFRGLFFYSAETTRENIFQTAMGNTSMTGKPRKIKRECKKIFSRGGTKMDFPRRANVKKDEKQF